MAEKSISQISLSSNQSLRIVEDEKQTQRFLMMGLENYKNVSKNKSKPEYELTGMNSIERLIFMSKREQLIIRLMINSIKWDKELKSMQYEVELSPDSVEFDKAAHDTMPYSSFLKGFALLHAGDIMRRTSKHKYMLNPDFLIYGGTLASHFRLMWHAAKQHPSLTVVKPIIKELDLMDDYTPKENDIFQ